MVRNLRQRIRRLGETAPKAVDAILVFFLAMIVVIVFLGVFFRYSPISGQMLWTVELARLFLVWAAFLAAGSVERFGGHFRIELIEKPFSGNKVGLTVQLLVKLIFLTSLGMLLWWTIPHAISQLDVTTLALMWPQVLFIIPLFLGSLLLFAYCMSGFIRNFRRLLE